jgi:hypothetical protein
LQYLDIAWTFHLFKADGTKLWNCSLFPAALFCSVTDSLVSCLHGHWIAFCAMLLPDGSRWDHLCKLLCIHTHMCTCVSTLTHTHTHTHTHTLIHQKWGFAPLPKWVEMRNVNTSDKHMYLSRLNVFKIPVTMYYLHEVHKSNTVMSVFCVGHLHILPLKVHKLW